MNPLQIGDQTCYFGSSETMSDVADSSVRLVVTSPPYWNLKTYGSGDEIGQSDYKTYLDRMNVVWSECARVARDDAVMVINVNSRRHKKEFYPIAFDIVNGMKGWKLWDVMIWYIPNALPQPASYIERLFDNKFEYLLVFTKGGETGYTCHKPRVPQKYRDADPREHNKNPRGRCLGNVIRIPAYRPPNVRDGNYHVAAYPEELASLLIETYSDPGDIVLDPFVGSGTTLKVSRVMRRAGIGFELNETFRPLIDSRVREHWEVPDWRKLDILHSATNEPGMFDSRKAHFAAIDASAPSLFSSEL